MLMWCNISQCCHFPWVMDCSSWSLSYFLARKMCLSLWVSGSHVVTCLGLAYSNSEHSKRLLPFFPSEILLLPYSHPLLFFFFKQIFIWMCWLSAAAYEIQFPDQGLNPGPLNWKPRVLAPGLQGKSQTFALWKTKSRKQKSKPVWEKISHNIYMKKNL